MFEIYLILCFFFPDLQSLSSFIFAVFKEVCLEVAKLLYEIIVLNGRIAYILSGLCNIPGMFLTFNINEFAQTALQSPQGR